MFRSRALIAFLLGLLSSGVLLSGCTANGSLEEGTIELLNVSYDPTRELWKDINAVFTQRYREETGVPLKITQSHAASGSQARAIVDGLAADVATLSLWPDTDALRKNGLVQEGWEERLPNRSLPYTSTVVFLVRKGNPKGIQDWADLAKEGTVVVTPSPKTSGNGRMTFLAAWGSVVLNGGSETEAQEFVRRVYKNVAVLDTGARGSTATFAIKGIGDVLSTMESEAYLTLQETPGQFEIVYPSLSFLHEPPVAVVDSVVERKGTRAHAEKYLQFLYTREGQEIIAKHFFRPIDPEVAAAHREQFPELRLFPVTEVAADWNDAQQKFFADGGIFDQLYQPEARTAAR
ncbi:MAG: sulfate ABC transporter substrate-binding protein [Planctomyces sp.]|nr:sulfate ABC transporter substrate-binding protein [Planctomyces sp.]